MATDFPAYIPRGVEATTPVFQYVPGQGATEVFVPGDLVFFSAGNDEMELCGIDPAIIGGFSEVDSEAHRVLTDDGRVPVRILSGDTIVAMSSATTPVVATHILVEYGITRNTSAPFNWLLDVAKTTTASRCTVVDVDVAEGIFYVRFHETALQFTPSDSAQV